MNKSIYILIIGENNVKGKNVTVFMTNMIHLCEF
jgi:hypothetical protein